MSGRAKKIFPGNFSFLFLLASLLARFPFSFIFLEFVAGTLESTQDTK